MRRFRPWDLVGTLWLVALAAALSACGGGSEPSGYEGSSGGSATESSDGGRANAGSMGATGNGGQSTTGSEGGTTGGGVAGSESTGSSGGAEASASGGGATTSSGTGADASAGPAGSDASRDGAVRDGATRPQDAGTDHTLRDSSPEGSSDATADGETAGGSTCKTTGSAGPSTPTVYVIGDSTASVYASNLYPRMGWAQPLQDFFTPACAQIQDKALSGRSSKSFYDEGHWTPIRTALKAGDYVLIQFGHNDEKSEDPTLYTEPFTTYEQYLSRYIDDTRAKSATPILITSIARNAWSGGTLTDTHGDYPVAMRQLAAASNVSLVDATALTTTYLEKLGQTAATALFMNLAPGQFPNYPKGNSDNTHLQESGARIIAQIILADLYRQHLAPGTLAKVVPQPP